MTQHFTSTATRDGRWWVVQCDQHPGAISQVARLDQAAEHQREAISFVADVPEDEIEVDVRPDVSDWMRDALATIERDRTEAERLQRHASDCAIKVAHALVEDEGLTLRDAGTILGVSHQRVAQLVQH